MGSDQVLEEVWAGQPARRGPKNHFSHAWASPVALHLLWEHCSGKFTQVLKLTTKVLASASLVVPKSRRLPGVHLWMGM